MCRPAARFALVAVCRLLEQLAPHGHDREPPQPGHSTDYPAGRHLFLLNLKVMINDCKERRCQGRALTKRRGTAPLPLTFIHPSACSKNSANFALLDPRTRDKTV